MNRNTGDLAVPPSWLASRLADGHTSIRVVDVRTDEIDRNREESGPRLRAASTVDLRTFGLGPTGWRASRARHPRRRGLPQAFLQSHVPGAVSLDVRASLFDDAGAVVSAPELALVMSSIGVGDAHTVVLVDEASAGAALAAAWALGRYGHADIHVLDGGFSRWVREGRPVSRDIVRHPVASFTARVSA